jgi:undecaprenyl-diphosphatase
VLDVRDPDPHTPAMSHRLRTLPFLLAAALCAAVLPLPAQTTGVLKQGRMPEAAVEAPRLSAVQAVVLGIVEGLTEYLPVSSTGHLILAQRVLGMDRSGTGKAAADAYAICIQGGAILAVLLVSRRRIWSMLKGLAGKDRAGLRLLANLIVAFLPAAIAGFLFEEPMKRHLYGLWPVTFAWLIGGIFLLAIAMRLAHSHDEGLAIDGLGWKQALAIGLLQCMALWPGISRSLMTILGGLLVGMAMPAAVEFSFLLGLVTLGAGTIYEGVKAGPEIVRMFGWVNPLIGILTAGVAAFLAVRWMLSSLNRRGLEAFGWYRICLAVVVGALLLTGVLA